MPATELAFLADVNVSIATGNGRFSAVDQWPVLGVHRGPGGRLKAVIIGEGSPRAARQGRGATGFLSVAIPLRVMNYR